MGAKTGIEWTDATWNPLRGCTRVSEGCRNCYAEGVAARFSGPGQPYEGLAAFVGAKREPRWTGKVALAEHLLDQPLRWKKPRRIFVNSMSDLLHESVPDEWLARIFAVMALAPQHTFQVLTKRPERMRAYLSTARRSHILARRVIDEFMCGTLPKKLLNNENWRAIWPIEAEGDPEDPSDLSLRHWPLPNVWLGVSVEDRPNLHARIGDLKQTPAAKRFLSVEPLLGDLGNVELDGIDWVIVGGESGPNARPMHPDWVRHLRDQCGEAGVPFFFKQWGEWTFVMRPGDPGWDEIPEMLAADTKPQSVYDACVMLPDGRRMQNYLGGDAYPPEARALVRVGKKAAGAMLDGREWREFPA